MKQWLVAWLIFLLGWGVIIISNRKMTLATEKGETWTWRTQWDQENWSVICNIRRIHMTNTWYASDWDQAYSPSYAKLCRTVVRHIQVHRYNILIIYSIQGVTMNQVWKSKWKTLFSPPYFGGEHKQLFIFTIFLFFFWRGGGEKKKIFSFPFFSGRENRKLFVFTIVFSGGENKKLIFTTVFSGGGDFIYTPAFLGQKMKRTCYSSNYLEVTVAISRSQRNCQRNTADKYLIL